MSQMSQLGGNTSTPRSRTWFFTYNNYEKDECHKITEYLKGTEYVFQEETGENGTPHLQGCIKFKNAKRFQEIKNVWPKWHLEKCKKWQAAIEYCTKKETRTGEIFTNIEFEDELEDTLPKELHQWQQDILDLIKEKPNTRKIHWYYDHEGNIGKTTLAKHICIHNKRAIYVSGKATDIKYAIATMKLKPKIVIMDIPRSMEQYVSYQAIEEIKNGIFFSSKYESGQVLFNTPHFIIFANFHPDMTKLSSDRWVIKNVGETPTPPFLEEEKWGRYPPPNPLH